MRKFAIVIIGISFMFVLIYFIGAGAIFLTGTAIKAIDDETKAYKGEIGKEIVIEGDTLTILDYSLVEQNFTLSNGLKVSKEFVIKDKE